MSQIPKNAVRLSEKWVAFLAKQPETGMGYQVVSVKVKGGQWYERVVVESPFIRGAIGYKELPFAVDDIDEIVVTHDKRDLGNWDFAEGRPRS